MSKRFMFMLLCCILITVLGCKHGLQYHSFDQVNSLEFLEFVGPNYEKELIEYKQLKFVIENKKIINNFIEATKLQSNTIDYPSIGHLAHLLCRDKLGKPMFVISIVNYKCIVTIFNCEQKGDLVVVDVAKLKGRPTCYVAQRFVKNIFEYMSENLSAELQKQKKYYAESGYDHEDLLFEGDVTKREE